MDSMVFKWLDMTRIDVKNQGEGNDVNVKVVSGVHCNVTHPDWFSKGGTGYVLETDDKHIMLELECEGAGDLLVRLQGIDRRFSVFQKRQNQL